MPRNTKSMSDIWFDSLFSLQRLDFMKLIFVDSPLESYMFAFENHETVKKIVSYLPAVGVGPNYGIPRTRYYIFYSFICLCNFKFGWAIMEDIEYLSK